MEKYSNVSHFRLASRSKTARNWKLQVDVSEPWGLGADADMDEATFTKVRDGVVKILEENKEAIEKIDTEDSPYGPIETLIDDLKHSDTVEEFDDHWQRMYDFADDVSIRPGCPALL